MTDSYGLNRSPSLDSIRRDRLELQASYGAQWAITRLARLDGVSEDDIRNRYTQKGE